MYNKVKKIKIILMERVLIIKRGVDCVPKLVQYYNTPLGNTKGLNRKFLA